MIIKPESVRERFFDTWIRHLFQFLGRAEAAVWDKLMEEVEAHHNKIIEGHQLFDQAMLSDKWPEEFEYHDLKKMAERDVTAARFIRAQAPQSLGVRGRQYYHDSLLLHHCGFKDVTIVLDEPETVDPLRPCTTVWEYEYHAPWFSVIGPEDEPFVEEVKGRLAEIFPKAVCLHTKEKKEWPSEEAYWAAVEASKKAPGYRMRFPGGQQIGEQEWLYPPGWKSGTVTRKRVPPWVFTHDSPESLPYVNPAVRVLRKGGYDI